MLNRNIKNTNYLYFLGGFVEGEGSMSVSVTIHKYFKYGVNIQPIFNVTQHKNGLNILNSYKERWINSPKIRFSRYLCLHFERL